MVTFFLTIFPLLKSYRKEGDIEILTVWNYRKENDNMEGTSFLEVWPDRHIKSDSWVA